MAFPTIAASLPTNGSGATATPTVQLPSPPVDARNVLVMLIRVAASGSISFPGWTALINAAPDASTDQVGIFYRASDGTEGTSVIGASASARFAAIVWEIAGSFHPSTQAPQVSTVAVSTTGQPNATMPTRTTTASTNPAGV